MTIKGFYGPEDFKDEDSVTGGRIGLGANGGFLRYGHYTQVDGTRGRYIGVSGQLVDIEKLTEQGGGSGLAATDNLIAATGLDAGSAPAVSTLYYAYVSNSFAKDFPRQLRLSTQPYTAFHGVKYLGTTENASNWRYVGMVYTIDAGAGVVNFADSLTQRYVYNEYNKRRTLARVRTGYVDDNAATTFTNAKSATFAKLNGGTGSDVGIVAAVDDVLDAKASVGVEFAAATDTASIGISVGGITDVQNNVFAPYSATENMSGVIKTSREIVVAANGLQTISIVQKSTATGASFTVIADSGRAGADADVATTFLEVAYLG